MVRKKYNVTRKDVSWEKYHPSEFGEELIVHHHALASRRNSHHEGKKQLWLLIVPLLDVSILNISLISCYIVGLLKDNIKPLPRVPFISDLGSEPPQSYIFTFGMTATSFTTFLIVFFRYKQVSFSREGCFNTISAIFGSLAALSKLVLGAFQYDVKFRWLHNSAFISYIFFSYLFIATQVSLTHHNRTPSSTATLFARLVIALLMLVFAALFSTFMTPTFQHMNCPPYNVAQVAQWVYWTLLNIYMMTFLRDFVWIRVSWNVRNSSMNEFTIDGSAGFLANSHELASIDSINDQSADVSRRSSGHKSLSEELPREFTTMV